ncbi:serine/threonine protein kinase [Pseudothauera rhizosphaerae]|uniref:HDOD domain-containing protein n=1 Tax=Pseudothauera rhizosphaerae TaxID=2565932 RepID=A0A4S4AW51_9RHOO|nr:serine/threonine protein kinase [Pseudothauera rhizosphaerae]THF63455.1 HDOD domain-containing protein [Pseudothauera rhizosphaerae]
MGESIGRFEIRKELGRGTQSVVYLAFDPHLEREVAVKTMHFAEASDRQNVDLLAEARIVSKLRHPGIVPIFEAGEQGGDLYLVFEYVPGESLARLTTREGPLPAPRAAALMADILAAVAHAHSEGVIHRDLKPSNVLIDGGGTPRVMDFGIARRVDRGGGTPGEFSGTPSYMAPEYVSARTVSEQTDVFAAGLILIEMLTGRRVFQGASVQAIMDRIAAAPAALPADVHVDERLAAIALRAAAHDPADRFRSAGEFRQALLAYLAPPETEAARGEAAQSTVDFLLRRMRHKSDFPALSESVSAINRIASDETESINKLSLTILRDFSLTNKILRLVNSAHFRQAGGGSISTISRAVIVLGFDAVRNIAITVLLFEHLQDKANAGQLKEEFLRANLAGLLAKDIAALLGTRDLEQAYICAVFHNLGRLLAQFYFPEESEEVRNLIVQKGCTETTAAQRVLGIGFEELGIGIARSWGFPALIVNSMQRPPAGTVRPPRTPEERLRTLSAYSNDLCQAIATLPPHERDKELARIKARYGEGLKVEDRSLQECIARSIGEITDFAQIVRINLRQTQFGQHLRRYAGNGAAEPPTILGDAALADAVLGHESPVGLDTDDFSGAGQKAVDAQAVLTAGIQDISNTLVSDFRLNDILRIILETMYRAMGFRRVLLCIKDARSDTMLGRFGFGPEANELARSFRFTLKFTPDIFHAATSKGVDILISDIDDIKIADRIPDWYRKASSARTFVLFPLTVKSNPVALIYADKQHANEIVITEKELQLLRTLRNQALLAIKQST